MLKKITFFIFSFYISFVIAEPKISNYKNYPKTNSEYKLQKLDVSFEYPWGITSINNEEMIISEKGGGLFKFNKKTADKTQINHNIQHIEYKPGGKQGGLLDVYFNSNDEYLYFTYSYDHDGKFSSSAIAKGKLQANEIIDFQDLLIASPKLKENRHYGSRIVINDETLYAGFGERGGEMIAQDPTTHPGSIIRIKTDGSVPNDNPHFTSHPDWLPEIYSIGVRNPQGIALTPESDVLFSSHGPRGGDHIAIAQSGANFGWKHISWGGSEYTGIKIGKSPFDDQFTSTKLNWVPSMAISSIQFYTGQTFPEWQGDLILCSLNGESLIRLDFEDGEIVGEEVILSGIIGRIRDFEIDQEGDIYLIADLRKSPVWKLTR
jgi:quinoprotein glucose dehydrogenase